MKKLVVLLASIALLAAACKSNTTIESTGVDDDVQATATADSDSSSNSSDDPEPQDGETSGVDVDDDPDATTAPASTATVLPATATAIPESGSAGSTPSATATPAPTKTPAAAAPVEPLPTQAEAIQAVLEANDWCGAAQAVEDGTAILDELDVSNPVSVQQGLTQAVAVASAAQPFAPAAIAGDVASSIDQFASFADALEEVEWDFFALSPEVLLEFDGGDATTTYNIEKYNFDNCGIGVDPGDPPVVGSSGTPDPLSPSGIPPIVLEGAALEQAVLGLTAAGFTEDEARCILQTLDLTNPAAFADTTAVLEVFTSCGISLDRLAQLGS